MAKRAREAAKRRSPPKRPVGGDRRADFGAPTDPWFAAIDGPLGPLARRLAKLVRTASPAMSETLKWGRPCWCAVPGHFDVALARYRDYLTLYFHHGVELADPRRRLSGSSSRMRGLRIARAADIDEREIKAWVRHAATRYA